MEKKVSIITPCYNGGNFLNLYFKSLLEQTYSNLEIIFVNDGSTDKTEKIVQKYRNDIENKGICFKYIKKKNEGIVSALNCGFKLFTGEYLSWIDVDDYMHPNYIDYKVKIFEENPEIDILITRVAYINASDRNKKVGYSWSVPPLNRDDFIKRILTRDGVGFEPGNHMVKSSSFKKYIPTLNIYDGGKLVGGQIQLLLPMIYHGKFLFIDECLYDYFIHKENHHKQFITVDQWVLLFQTLNKVYEEAIMQLNSGEEEKLKKIAIQAIEVEKFEIALEYEDVNLLRASFKEMTKYNVSTLRHKRIAAICINKPMIKLYNKIRKVIYKL